MLEEFEGGVTVVLVVEELAGEVVVLSGVGVVLAVEEVDGVLRGVLAGDDGALDGVLDGELAWELFGSAEGPAAGALVEPSMTCEISSLSSFTLLSISSSASFDSSLGDFDMFCFGS